MTSSKKKNSNLSGLKNEEAYHPFIKKKYRQIGNIFARSLVKTNVTPNEISILAFLILCLSSYFFFRADYTSLIIAAGLLQIGYLFDFIDGSLSRMRHSASDYGDWFDRLSGLYGYTLIYIGATLGVYSQLGKPHILVFGLLGSIGALIKGYTQQIYLTKFKFAYKFGQEKYKKLGFLMFFRPTAPFKVTIFTLGALFNEVYLVLIFLGIYNPLYTIIQNLIFTLKIRKEFLKEKKST